MTLILLGLSQYLLTLLGLPQCYLRMRLATSGLTWNEAGMRFVTSRLTQYKLLTLLKLTTSSLSITFSSLFRIIDSLNQNERGLFKERIKYLDKKISPGLSKLTWNSKGTTDTFITDCRNTAEKIQRKIDCFKADNLKIATSCVQISEMLLTDIDSRKIYKELEFGTHQVDWK